MAEILRVACAQPKKSGSHWVPMPYPPLNRERAIGCSSTSLGVTGGIRAREGHGFCVRLRSHAAPLSVRSRTLFRRPTDLFRCRVRGTGQFTHRHRGAKRGRQDIACTADPGGFGPRFGKHRALAEPALGIRSTDGGGHGRWDAPRRGDGLVPGAASSRGGPSR